jgi:replicative DNA helicase
MSDAERAVVGALLIDPTGLPEAVNYLGVDGRKFATPAGLVYSAIVELTNNGTPIDFVTLSDFLSKRTLKQDKNRTWLDAAGSLPEYMTNASAANVDSYAKLVADTYQTRELVKLAASIIASTANDPPDKVMAMLEAGVVRIRGDMPTTIRTIAEVAREYARFLADMIANPGRTRGFKTGMPAIDDIVGSLLQPGRLVTVAGRPGSGKTQTMIAWAMTLATQRTPVVFYSLEMSYSEIVNRMIAYQAKVDSKVLAENPEQLLPKDMEQVQEVLGHFVDGHYPIYIECGGMNIPSLQSHIRRTQTTAQREWGASLGAIFVDYIQLVNPTSARGKREEEVSEVSRAVKLMTLDETINCPIVQGCQLSREIEKRADKAPLLSDLRESGTLEQNSDAVIFTYPPFAYMTEKERTQSGYKNGFEPMEYHIGKNRHGPTGRGKCIWHKPTGRFYKESHEPAH